MQIAAKRSTTRNPGATSSGPSRSLSTEKLDGLWAGGAALPRAPRRLGTSTGAVTPGVGSRTDVTDISPMSSPLPARAVCQALELTPDAGDTHALATYSRCLGATLRPGEASSAVVRAEPGR